MPKLKIMSRDHGHKEIDWNTVDFKTTQDILDRFKAMKEPEKQQSEEPLIQALHHFEELTEKQRFSAFRANPDKSHTRIKIFDPKAEEILLVPALVGG